MAPRGRDIDTLQIGWNVRLRCRHKSQRSPGHKSPTIEGRLIRRSTSPTRGTCLDVAELGSGKFRSIPVRDVVRAERVLGSLEERRRGERVAS